MKKQEKLDELKSRLAFTKFYIDHNKESSNTKFYKAGKTKGKVEGEARKIRLPFTILKVDEYPKIEMIGPDNYKYSLKDFKVVKDYQLLKFKIDEAETK